ncbi:MAG: response regulator [Acidobacteria bacterium]|nr:response regulator [Acidobacteriota bacterium]
MATEPTSFPGGYPFPLSVMQRDELERLKGQFLASLNHEIRTPLSGVLGMTDLLLETELLPDQGEYVRAARECALHLLEVLNSVLAYSALQAGTYRFESSEFAPRELAQSIGEEAGTRAAMKGLAWELTVDDSVPATVIGSARHLREAVWQIVQNGLKFTHEGSVEVRMSCDAAAAGAFERTLRIEVRDTGIGIPSDQLIQIFDSFSQLENGLARSYSGLGLGLAIADKLARKMGGLIQAESEPGKGSVFTVLAPVKAAAQDTLARPHLVPRQHGTSRRILHVDDNAIAQQIVHHVLSREHYEVVTAGGGEEAVEIARDQEFDLVLMDLQMPRQDGLATTAAIRRLAHHAATPIVAVSANSADEHRENCARHGMQGFISKPIDRQILIKTVERTLAASRI